MVSPVVEKISLMFWKMCLEVSGREVQRAVMELGSPCS